MTETKHDLVTSYGTMAKLDKNAPEKLDDDDDDDNDDDDEEVMMTDRVRKSPCCWRRQWCCSQSHSEAPMACLQ